MKKALKLLTSLILAAITAFSTLSAAAKSVSYAPYRGYEYNDYDESVSAPTGYVPELEINSYILGIEEPLNNPSDLYYDNNGQLYILDSGNSRIITLNKDFKLERIYSGFKTENGEEIDFTGAQGMTVGDNGLIYVADTENTRVLVIEENTVKNIITRPDSALLNSDTPFQVTKIQLDRKGYIYVIAQTVNLGAFVFEPDGTFANFFGSNPIIQTAEVIANFIRKKFMTKAQIAAMEKQTPITFTNFDIDADGLFYTVTRDLGTRSSTGMVRCLNYDGNDVIEAKSNTAFGDLEWDRDYWAESKVTKFVDISIDADGFINLLDQGRGRVFQYTADGKLVTEFGGYGEQTGLFENPSSLETVDGKIVVADSKSGELTVFRPTEYAAQLRKGFLLLNGSDADGAMEIWENILKQNTNSQYPYYGLGMVYDAKGDYKNAMKNFKLAGAHTEYSKAFREYRKEFVSEYYWIIILGIIAAVVIISFTVGKIKKIFVAEDGSAFSKAETKYAFPLYTVFHPADGFAQFKTRNLQSYLMAFIFVVLWFVAETVEFFNTGYAFNSNRDIDYNFLVTFISTIGAFLLFVAANWSVCTLCSGKGRLKEIVAVVGYSLIPMITAKLINVFLSNILTLEESAFMSIITIIGVGWSAIMLLIGLYMIHQYSFMGTVGSVLLTVIGMLIIAFLIVLLCTLIQQTVSFVRSIVSEMSLR